MVASSATLDQGYTLQDRYDREEGRVFITGTQALVRLLMEQRRRDRAQGLNTAGFVSGYRGSPVAGLDLALWEARGRLEQEGIRFQPGLNEALAATAVLGSQQVESEGRAKVDGVFGMWYGKGPGVDWAGDAIKHANAYGTSPRGGVLLVAGDDHGAVSSTMAHQSDQTLAAWSIPVLNPAGVADYLELGLYGWALVALLGRLGGAEGDLRDRRERRHRRAARSRAALRHAGRFRAASGRSPLPLAGPAQRRDRGAASAQARGRGGVRTRQCAGSADRRGGGRLARHRHRRQGAWRPDGGAAPAGRG